MKIEQLINESVEDRTSYQVAKILASKGIKYDPAKEDELINVIGLAMIKGLDMDPRTVRHLMRDDDFIADTLGELRHMDQGMSEDHEIQMADSELKSIYQNSRKLLRLIKHYSEQEGLEAWQQSKITKAADYLNSVLQAVSGKQTR